MMKNFVFIFLCMALLVGAADALISPKGKAHLPSKHCGAGRYGVKCPDEQITPIPNTTLESIFLEWDLPTLREDSSAIEQIDEFRIYMSRDDGPETVMIVAGTAISHTVDQLASGSYKFEISTVESGQEGARSLPIIIQV